MTTIDAGAEPALDDGPGDTELISQVRTGSSDAYAVLYRRHQAAAHRLAGHLAGDRAQADDLVSEAFAVVYEGLVKGGGPDTFFRSYLLTTLRTRFYNTVRKDKRLLFLDDHTALDTPVEFEDPSLASFESAVAAKAFASLPERWQTVLWHTEIEGQRASEVAAILGIAPAAVSALAYRAREGLREAYLEAHLAQSPAVDDGCRFAAARLGRLVRGGLTARETDIVEGHLSGCVPCQTLLAELSDANGALRAVIAPLILGMPLAGYLAPAARHAAAAHTATQSASHSAGHAAAAQSVAAPAAVPAAAPAAAPAAVVTSALPAAVAAPSAAMAAVAAPSAAAASAGPLAVAVPSVAAPAAASPAGASPVAAQAGIRAAGSGLRGHLVAAGHATSHAAASVGATAVASVAATVAAVAAVAVILAVASSSPAEPERAAALIATHSTAAGTAPAAPAPPPSSSPTSVAVPEPVVEPIAIIAPPVAGPVISAPVRPSAPTEQADPSPAGAQSQSPEPAPAPSDGSLAAAAPVPPPAPDPTTSPTPDPQPEPKPEPEPEPEPQPLPERFITIELNYPLGPPGAGLTKQINVTAMPEGSHPILIKNFNTTPTGWQAQFGDGCTASSGYSSCRLLDPTGAEPVTVNIARIPGQEPTAGSVVIDLYYDTPQEIPSASITIEFRADGTIA